MIFSLSLQLGWSKHNTKPHRVWLEEKEVLEISLLSPSFIAFYRQLYLDVGDCLA